MYKYLPWLTIAFVDYKPGVQTNTSLPARDWPVGQLKFAVGLIDSLCKCTSFGALGQWAEKLVCTPAIV